MLLIRMASIRRLVLQSRRGAEAILRRKNSRQTRGTRPRSLGDAVRENLSGQE